MVSVGRLQLKREGRIECQKGRWTYILGISQSPTRFFRLRPRCGRDTVRNVTYQQGPLEETNPNSKTSLAQGHHEEVSVNLFCFLFFYTTFAPLHSRRMLCSVLRCGGMSSLKIRLLPEIPGWLRILQHFHPWTPVAYILGWLIQSMAGDHTPSLGSAEAQQPPRHEITNIIASIK